MLIAILLVLAYLIGSIPSAVWVSKWVFGLDIREHGSGNAGATNCFRILGSKAGSAVMLMDMLKGFLAVKLVILSGLPHYWEAYRNLEVFLGLASVLGHIFPIWAEFRGGKGIATLFGMILSIQPAVAVSLVAVFFCMLYLTRYVSLSSITASIAFPVMIVFIFNAHELSYKLFAIATACLVVLTHYKNISRLINGNESKVGFFRKKKDRHQ
ncbi:acyl-phosphate glycerol 3-phosphate acyltransferase [Flavipsychrobacter stenotrophus]|uniref:Glycerol-3-phosphate acyltransferase n=1 Tax=Flavipsychrobacter stenotrophus TaxID=2077091 RepID=A0A2S7SWU3_9BACT|nr:glycerol-3-phosphate 1-O-acyltransferase PlsY [Flavipsychrobacter stenotrophus]PQJ11399.1 acyl-phosphate glycerol 3-phosphate acyltransferase [Flavipsychrobacter stenotrophus]